METETNKNKPVSKLSRWSTQPANPHSGIPVWEPLLSLCPAGQAADGADTKFTSAVCPKEPWKARW